MQRQHGRRPRLSDCVALVALFLTLLGTVATADFHDTHGVPKGDIHTIAVVLTVVAGLVAFATVVWWTVWTLTHLRKETPEEVVAKIKEAAQHLQGELTKAETKVAKKR